MAEQLVAIPPYRVVVKASKSSKQFAGVAIAFCQSVTNAAISDTFLVVPWGKEGPAEWFTRSDVYFEVK